MVTKILPEFIRGLVCVRVNSEQTEAEDLATGESEEGEPSI